MSDDVRPFVFLVHSDSISFCLTHFDFNTVRCVRVRYDIMITMATIRSCSSCVHLFAFVLVCGANAKQSQSTTTNYILYQHRMIWLALSHSFFNKIIYIYLSMADNNKTYCTLVQQKHKFNYIFI